MAVITLRVEDEVKAEMDALADRLGITTSELMRRSISATLVREAEPKAARSPESAAIPSSERLTLSLLHEILYWQKATVTKRKVGGDPVDADPEHHLEALEILAHGYSAEYDRINGFVDQELSEDQCRFVWDVLDLYRIVGASVAHMSDEDRALFSAQETSFRGFDLNDRVESALLTYCRFLFSTDRWEEVSTAALAHTDRYNSHSPMTARYQAMLGKWRAIQQSRRRTGHSSVFDDLYLSAAEVRQILDAPKSVRRS